MIGTNVFIHLFVTTGTNQKSRSERMSMLRSLRKGIEKGETAEAAAASAMVKWVAGMALSDPEVHGDTKLHFKTRRLPCDVEHMLCLFKMTGAAAASL